MVFFQSRMVTQPRRGLAGKMYQSIPGHRPAKVRDKFAVHGHDSDTSGLHPATCRTSCPPGQGETMDTTAVRDLHDWVTGFAVLQELMRTKLASPLPEYRAPDAHLSSRSLGWRGLSFDQEDLATTASRPSQVAGRHLVIVSLGRGRITLNGAHGVMGEEMQPGGVMVYPADESVLWSAPSTLRCCVLGLDAAMLDRVAGTTYRAVPGDFELVPVARAYDFGIVGLAGVLAEEALRGARGNNLYVNSLANTLAVHLLRHYATW